MVNDLIFTIPSDMWLSSNQRLHWTRIKDRVAWLRDYAARRIWIGQKPDFQYQRPVKVTAHIGYSTKGRADPANAHPTVKALVDGLVECGLFQDDDHTHLLGPDYRRDETKAPRGFHTVRFEIEEVR